MTTVRSKPIHDYREIGRLSIDKSKAKTRIQSRGELSIVDLNQALLHIDGEQIQELQNRPIISLRKPEDHVIRGLKCQQNLRNVGQFGPQYDLVATGLRLETGIRGQAIGFIPKSRTAVFAMGPFDDQRAMSVSTWVKISSKGHQVLINATPIWGRA